MNKKTNHIRLKPYEEATGRFQGLKKDEYILSILFGGFEIAFRVDSSEAAIIEQNLATTPVGERIGILSTDLADKPVLIRIITASDAISLDTEVNSITTFENLGCYNG